ATIMSPSIATSGSTCACESAVVIRVSGEMTCAVASRMHGFRQSSRTKMARAESPGGPARRQKHPGQGPRDCSEAPLSKVVDEGLPTVAGPAERDLRNWPADSQGRVSQGRARP